MRPHPYTTRPRPLTARRYAGAMVHLRIVAPHHSSKDALELLNQATSVCNVIYLPNAASKPSGDVILCDVAREDTSVILSDLRELNIPTEGSIAMELIDSTISDASDRAEQAARGAPSDAVIWEEVEARTSESTELSVSFVALHGPRDADRDRPGSCSTRRS